MAVQQQRTWYSTTFTIGRVCFIVAAVILLLFAFGVLKDNGDVSWEWLGVGLLATGWAIG